MPFYFCCCNYCLWFISFFLVCFNPVSRCKDAACFFSTTMLGNGGASTSTAAEGRRRRRRSLNAYINKPCRYLSLAKVQQYVLTSTLRHGLSVAQAVLTMSTNWTENVSLSGIAIYEQILTHFLNGLIRGRPKRGKGSCFYGVRQSEDTHDAAVSTHVGGGRIKILASFNVLQWVIMSLLRLLFCSPHASCETK